jgi:hypothetical protein
MPLRPALDRDIPQAEEEEEDVLLLALGERFAGVRNSDSDSDNVSEISFGDDDDDEDLPAAEAAPAPAAAEAAPAPAAPAAPPPPAAPAAAAARPARPAPDDHLLNIRDGMRLRPVLDRDIPLRPALDRDIPPAARREVRFNQRIIDHRINLANNPNNDNDGSDDGWDADGGGNKYGGYNEKTFCTMFPFLLNKSYIYICLLILALILIWIVCIIPMVDTRSSKHTIKKKYLGDCIVFKEPLYCHQNSLTTYTQL